MDDRSHQIIEVARRQLLANPESSMADIARAAEVGMSAVYRRFANRNDLIAAIALDGLEQFNALTAAFLARDPHSSETLKEWIASIVNSGALTLGPVLAGRFPVSEDHRRAAQHAYTQLQDLLRVSQEGSLLKPWVTVTDIVLMLEGIGAVRLPDPESQDMARRRLIEVALGGLAYQSQSPTSSLNAEVLFSRWG